MSELDHLIPPEIINDEFSSLIQKLAQQEKLSHVLEIGSSAGDGSTQAFVAGLSQNAHQPQLHCLEISKPRFMELRDRYASFPFVHCYNASSVGIPDFPSAECVCAFYKAHNTSLNAYPLEMVLGWLTQDLKYLETSGALQNGISIIKQLNNIPFFDMVLIDGSEFTGEAELNSIYGATIIMLDDTNAFKNYNNYHKLANDQNYDLYYDNWTVRNGFAIFKQKDS